MGAANSIVLLLIKIAGWAVMGISIISFIISLITFIVALKKIEKLKSQTEPDFVETTAEEKKIERKTAELNKNSTAVFPL